MSNQPHFKPRIAISMGDPAGVGPELCLALLNDLERTARSLPLVIGDWRTLHQVAQRLNLPLQAQRVASPSGEQAQAAVWDLPDKLTGYTVIPGVAHPQCGQAAGSYIRAAVELCLSGQAQAMVTAPINKHALHLGGLTYPGHTEMIAELTASPEYAMLMYSQPKSLAVAFVTCHQALSSVPEQLRSERIVLVGTLLNQYLRQLSGKATPRLAVLGLNPHAGEEGVFGDEEAHLIAPAVQTLRRLGIDAHGPVVPDAAFTSHGLKRYDGHVAMYHDQGNIPFKMMAFESGVNITMGVKIVRTSPDHGTAYDIAWQGHVGKESFFEAYDQACRLAEAQRNETRSIR